MSLCFSSRRKVNDSFIVKLDQDEIKEVGDFKFLGVILDTQLKFDKHVKKLCKTVMSQKQTPVESLLGDQQMATAEWHSAKLLLVSRHSQQKGFISRMLYQQK